MLTADPALRAERQNVRETVRNISRNIYRYRMRERVWEGRHTKKERCLRMPMSVEMMAENRRVRPPSRDATDENRN